MMTICIKKTWAFCAFFTACFIILTGAICGAQADAKNRLKVTLLIYSGRPNPTFFIEDQLSIDKVKSLVAELIAVENPDGEATGRPILGYNGIIVENPDGMVADLPTSMHVLQNGNVIVMDGKLENLKDQTNALEKFLLSIAEEKKVIDQKIFEKIEMNQ